MARIWTAKCRQVILDRAGLLPDYVWHKRTQAWPLPRVQAWG